MKKGIIRLLIIGCLLLSFGITLGSKSKVKASLSFDDFHEFVYTISPKIKNGIIMWEININWFSTEQIKYIKVITTLEDGHEENTYETGRRNMAILNENKVDIDEVTTYWYYELKFSVNTEDLQRIKMNFNYSYNDEIAPTHVIDKVIFISTGNTIVNDEISLWYAVLTGIIISICASVATFIIIKNTKNNLIKISNEEENTQDE